MTFPTGTVTFLFTDIEGSTRQWDAHPEAMAAALRRHDTLMREAIESNGGAIFKTVGDAFCAAFSTALNALAATLAAQRALQAEPWPEHVQVRVRMALHTGATEERDGDYFGPPLNRVARLLSLGYGGQTLLSQTTHDLVRDSLPPPALALDLGLHHLKDLQRPEQVFQLNHPDLPAIFAPLRSLDNPKLPNNLPRQLTSFIGREAEREQILAVLARTHLLTLAGTGGVGKTRLAIAVAEEVAEEYRDGVCFVDLAPLQDPVLVVKAVMVALGIREEANRPLIETLLDALQARSLLLILDNCEHLAEACASLAEALLSQCPHLRLLATSRQPLGVGGERTWRVPSLTLPEGNEKAWEQEKGAQTLLLGSEAVRLFVERAVSAQPSFRLTRENLGSVAELCRLLDGIPLALELSAAWVRMMPVGQVVSRLRERLDLRQSRTPGRLVRHETLRATLDWSYELLEERERRLLRRLSVFAGGWSLEAAEAICGEAGEGPDGVLMGLASLVDRSLVVYTEWEEMGRYRLLETTRQYAREKLAASGESERCAARHRDFFLAMAEEAWDQRYGAESSRQMDLLEREHDNCQASLDFCTASSNAETHLRLVGTMYLFWEWRGRIWEGRARLAAALSRPDAQEVTAPRARALNGAAVLAMAQNEPRAARSLYQQSEEAWRALGEKRALAMVLSNLGVLERQELRYDLAETFFDESLALMRDLNDRAGIALVLINIGRLARLCNDPVRARPSLEESVAVCRDIGNLFVLEAALGEMAQIAMQQGDDAAARVQFREALTLLTASRNHVNVVEVLEPVVELMVRSQRPRQGVRLFAAFTALRERYGLPLFPCDRADYDRREQLLRSALDAEMFAQEWATGLVLTVEELLALAMEEISKA